MHEGGRNRRLGRERECFLGRQPTISLRKVIVKRHDQLPSALQKYLHKNFSSGDFTHKKILWEIPCEAAELVRHLIITFSSNKCNRKEWFFKNFISFGREQDQAREYFILHQLNIYNSKVEWWFCFSFQQQMQNHAMISYTWSQCEWITVFLRNCQRLISQLASINTVSDF